MRVYSGVDPVTGKEVYLAETINGTDKAARRRAEKVLTRLQAQVDQQRAPSTSVSFSYAIDEWLRSADIEPTTRHGYVGYIERTIRPALGHVSVSKLNARMLETLYGELRRCRIRCSGKPFVEHRAEGERVASDIPIIRSAVDAVTYRAIACWLASRSVTVRMR